MGEVKARPSPIVLTHSPLGSVVHLTSTPMVPTHPKIPRTAPDPPGELTQSRKREKPSVSEGDESDLGEELKRGGGVILQRDNDGQSFLWEKSSDSEIGMPSGSDRINTVESLTHSLAETIETHVPTRVPFVHLPQASSLTIRPTDGIQYTPRAEVSPVTPGTLSTPGSPMVTPLTPWVTATPRTYWSESFPVTPWVPATPVTQKRSEIQINYDMTATSATKSQDLPTKSESLWWNEDHQMSSKAQTHTTSTTTTGVVPVRGKLSIPSPYGPFKPTLPSTPVTLKGTSMSQHSGKVAQTKDRNLENLTSEHRQSSKGYSKGFSDRQDRRPLGDVGKDLNPQLARIWGGSDNKQLSALEEDLYRDSDSWPWMSGRRMRRKLSTETKSIFPENRSMTSSTESPKQMLIESRRVLSADETKNSIGNQEEIQQTEGIGNKGNTVLEAKLKRKEERSLPPDMVKHNIKVDLLPEKKEMKSNHDGKPAKTLVDFRITKTGDFGGFSVTKTEEIDVNDQLNPSKYKNNSGKSDTFTDDNVSKNEHSNVREVKAVSNIFTDDNEKVFIEKLPRQGNSSKTHVVSEISRIFMAGLRKDQVPSLNSSDTDSRSLNNSTFKPTLNGMHSTNDKRAKTQDESDSGRRHSSPFIINSKSLREYKATADAHMVHRLTKNPSQKHTITPTKIFPITFKTGESSSKGHPSKIRTTTTLSSIFKEEIIPPVPYGWIGEWHDPNSEGIARKSINNGNITPNKTNQDLAAKSDTTPHKSAQQQFSDSSSKSIRVEDLHSSRGNLQFVGEELGSWNNMPKYDMQPSTTKATQSLDKDLESSLVATLPGIAEDISATHKNSVETREAREKVDKKVTAWPGMGERVEFVTVVPGGQWDVWGGPSLLDPLLPRNHTRRNPQVYSVYWGDTGGPGSPSGWPEGVWVIRGGSLTAIMALVVTISVQVARDGPAHRGSPTADTIHRAQHNQHATLATNLATSLASAHVLLIFGIQATGKAWVCGVVGLLLHFLHLVSCCWLLALTVRLLVSLHNCRPVHTAVYCTASWGASLGLVVISYVVNPEGYETRRYCWMSVERGMLVSFIVPVCSLILVNAGVCVAAQKVLLDMRDGVKHEVMTQYKRDLRGAVSLLPLEGISWFLAVVALEDHQSLALDFAAALVSACLGWLVLYFHGWTWRCHGLCWLRRQITSSRRVDDLSLPLTARYDHDLVNQPLIPTPTPNPVTQPHTTVTLSSPATPSQPLQSEEFPLQPIFPLHERREAY